MTEPRNTAEQMLSAAHERITELEGRAFGAERSLEVAQARIRELEAELRIAHAQGTKVQEIAARYREALEQIRVRTIDDWARTVIDEALSGGDEDG